MEGELVWILEKMKEFEGLRSMHENENIVYLLFVATIAWRKAQHTISLLHS